MRLHIVGSQQSVENNGIRFFSNRELKLDVRPGISPARLTMFGYFTATFVRPTKREGCCGASPG